MRNESRLILSFAGLLLMAGGACTQDATSKTSTSTSGKSPCQTRQETLPQIPNTDAVIELSGSGLEHPMLLSFDQLATMKMTTLDSALMQRTHAPDIKTSWRGPALADILAKAGIKPGPMMLKLEATDGYSIKTGLEAVESAIIAIQDGDGRWLSEIDAKQPIRLIAPKATGNYWVANIHKITVTPPSGS